MLFVWKRIMEAGRVNTGQSISRMNQVWKDLLPTPSLLTLLARQQPQKREMMIAVLIA